MADFQVTNNNDSGAGSLRQAILDANKNAGADRILVSGNIKLNSAIQITDSVAIVNVGETVITQKGSDRLFYIDDGDTDKVSQVRFVGIRMTGGNTEGSGGAIYSHEDLTLVRSQLVGNTAGESGGAVYLEGATLKTQGGYITKNQAETGGGIALFDADAKLNHSKISGNSAIEAGGISVYYDSSLKLNKATVADNNAEQSGGGIASAYYSDVEIISSTISGNTAKINGGISISDGTLKAISSEVLDNQAENIGGIGISYHSQAQINDSNISGNAATKGSAGGIGVSYLSSLELTESFVDNNSATKLAGGINLDNSQAVISNTTINDNKAQGSGGINVTDESSLSLTESQVAGNTATKLQAGGIGISDSSVADIKISSVIGNKANQAEGGGINVTGDSSLRLENTSVAENIAAETGGGINADTNSEVEVTKSTIAENQAGIGGGLSASDGSSLQLEDIAVIDNQASGFGGGINVFFGSELKLNRGTVSGNTAPVVGGINLANGSSGEIANSSVDNNVADISGGGINVFQDSQLELFNTSVTDNTNGGIQSYGESNIVNLISSTITGNSLSNISGDGLIFNPISQVIEAEDIASLDGYRLESNSLASGGKLLSLAGHADNEVGTANFNFTGETGYYAVKIGTYDENDGAARIQLAQQGNTVGSIVLDENAGSNGIAEDTKVTKVIAANIFINQGDNFSLTGFEDGREHARIDFIEFEAVARHGEGTDSNPIGETPTPTPTPNPDPNPDPNPAPESIRWEAEAADSLMGYRTENIADASGGKVLSFLGEAGEESGKASFTVGTTGTYDILLATYDENDGAASFNLELNGSQIGDTLVLDEDLGSNVADAQTAVKETIAFGVSLEAGDILTVNGFENANEHARLDYLEFIPSETGF